MRKLILQVQMSIDGYIAGPNGEMDWMVWNWDDELKQYTTKINDPTDTIVLGRKLAQGFIPYWASNPQEEGADKINSAKKVVFTKTLQKSEWENTVLAKGDIVDEINQLKKQEGNDIIAFGGATFVSSLIKHNLIDDYHLFINPTAIGNGMPIFKEIDGKQNFSLIKATPFNCGIVVQHYQPKRS
ncbi:MAG: dihydrofolate reductase family protein [Bacteroidia bacterium]